MQASMCKPTWAAAGGAAPSDELVPPLSEMASLTKEPQTFFWTSAKSKGLPRATPATPHPAHSYTHIGQFNNGVEWSLVWQATKLLLLNEL